MWPVMKEEDLSTLNIVEVGGEGGVYQHVLGAAEFGSYRSWERIVLHTSRDAEIYPAISGLEFHKCMRWQRSGPRWLRRILTSLWVACILLPHLAWEAWNTRSDWEIQGQFGRGLYFLFILVPAVAKRRVVFAPHNSFLRHGGLWEAPILTLATSVATKTVVYVQSERSRFPSARKIEQRMLWQYAPSPDPAYTAGWQRRLHPDRSTILFAGQLRHDKNPLLLIEAVNTLDIPVNLVFAGQDKGAGAVIREAFLDARHARIVDDRFLDLKELVSLIALCDIVVCPYQLASQSGVVALANQLGRAVVVSSAGGLGDQSPLKFDLGDDQIVNLASVIGRALGHD